MSKRKLTRQQAWRIEKTQKERLDRASRHKAQVEKLLEAGVLGQAQAGRIVARFGKQVEVIAVNTQGQPIADPIRCHLRSNLASLVTGDQVVFRTTNDAGIVIACEPRRNVLERPDSRGVKKAMAANIDQLVIVTALEPAPQPELLDRYLVATEVAGIPPLIVINKVDLLQDSEVNRNFLAAIKNLYEVIGYTVVEATTAEAGGLNALSEHLTDKSSVFIGQSGVGKSSLVQALLPNEQIRVGHLHHQTRLGRHTTSTARFYVYAQGGSIIDSPGIRDFGLEQISRTDVEQGFIDIREFSDKCRFRDCRHRHEPGCAVTDAVQKGKLSRRRLESFHRILDTLTGGNA
ncbi:small ribosomal subunit biogenesis GTPase RsgA [Litorivicinus sp.]|nr:small ribosomal subunit biogenesis GTPase RsgA [Litorivicinus sp.]MEC8694095.1 small ribosomal subunit biogenesis GTPase RsgA [Pseudomonadota bacterium]MEC9077005.1 small ribosomal subunit biogenesis GTPase RsgA [Pseudomonadota bacterium]